MRIRFWGVRGSIPSPGPETGKYGGNTACIELRVGSDDRIIIIDAGSGIRMLGNELMANDLPKGAIKAEIFLSHTHWDHIMGYPFFTPIYIPTTEIKVYGPVTFEDDPLEDVVGGQMKYRYFPVNLGELSSNIEYIRLKEDPSIDLGEGYTLRQNFLTTLFQLSDTGSNMREKLFARVMIPNLSEICLPPILRILSTMRPWPRREKKWRLNRIWHWNSSLLELIY
ncbi:hypothetical protein DGMP_20430 [Desulfomarina profundi]|uniref:MBL fold metallo-hydrolase n=1 Tax=Desulfomarina profundi TaxID=2772557 RepID=A0A8D5FPG1_9BACT|nr:MBL fold metallo-hydrolase [Desulfomarina profundi]BCL61350.1 hypothetical protein DGMP_20430 [Desulfomarina profundi]